MRQLLKIYLISALLLSSLGCAKNSSSFDQNIPHDSIVTDEQLENLNPSMVQEIGDDKEEEEFTTMDTKAPAITGVLITGVVVIVSILATSAMAK